MEFERLISGTGPVSRPGIGKLTHPGIDKPVGKIAWFQCVGSRDVQTDSPFCSSVCCMISIKQAILAQKKFGPDIETTIFYMDMRTIGKSSEDYRFNAQKENHVNFVRARIHSLSQPPAKKDTSLLARYVDIQGDTHEAEFDLVVLANGQRPAEQMTAFAKKNNMDVNPWGFIQPRPFSMVKTSREGIFCGGSISGLKDIGDSVTCASAAALGACKIMVHVGKTTTQASDVNAKDGDPKNTVAKDRDPKDTGAKDVDPTKMEDQAALARENPRILTVLCSCGKDLSQTLDLEILRTKLGRIPETESIEIMDNFCMDEGFNELIQMIQTKKPNRLVIGACLPGIQKQRIKELGYASGLHPSLVERLDIMSIVNQTQDSGIEPLTWKIIRELKIQISKARYKNPVPEERIVSNQNAMVIGGGIAGITTALSIADSGYHVDLVEEKDTLGGNLLWMDKTVDNLDIQAYLSEKIKQLESHERITVYKKARVETSENRPGEFATVLTKENDQTQNIFHGVTILATGGSQAKLELEKAEDHPRELTQKEFEIAVQDHRIEPEKLEAVVMIQCSGTRDEKRNYCSRVCCIRALKNAIFLKEKNPDIQVYILYRDMMSYGFYEEYYTRAKKIGVIFFQYDHSNKPVSQTYENKVIVKTHDLLLDLPVEIEADYVIHATGIVSDLPFKLADQFGASLDVFHFFKEADSKFRPVDSMNYRVFACGLSLKPCTIEEAVASAEASAIRAIRILSHDHLISGKTVAATHTTTCSLCKICVDTCPYGARFVDELEEKIVIDPAACQGCGVCAAICPSDSAFLEGFDSRQMLDVIDMALS